jgi:putative tricarboxylic transport membrane protein
VDRRVDYGISFLIIGVGIFILITSLVAKQPTVVFDPIGPYGFARVIAVVFMVLGSVLVIRQVRAAQAGLPPEAVAHGSEDEEGHPASSRRAGAVIGATFAYAIFMPALGYLITSVTYVIAALLLFNERTLRWIVPLAVIYAVFTYWLFEVMLNVPLPAGPAEDLLVTLGILDRVR